MKVKLPEAVAKKLSPDSLRLFGIEKDAFEWRKWVAIDLSDYGAAKIRRFRELVEPHVANVRGGRILLNDIDTWLAVLAKDTMARPRNTEHFAAIVTKFLAKVPGHRVFSRNDARGEAWLCSYVNDVEFHPEVVAKEHRRPAYTEIEIMWVEFGGRKVRSLSFHDSDVRGLPVEETLARAGLYPETAERRDTYLKELERFRELRPLVGKQFLASGVATDEMDGNPKREASWWNRRTNKIVMERDEQRSRVVIDVFHEGDDGEDEDEDKGFINEYFWKYERNRTDDDDLDEDDDDRKELPRRDTEEGQTPIEVPIHPFLGVFDLRRHLRLRIHVNYLTEYAYDLGLGSKLILPRETTELVEMLVSHKGVFKDIVSGKGGGAIVLCAGPPGTGKTLTAEVYSEVMARPLYSVQCSQLGTDPDSLEDELLKVFARSMRWNAILLLDEADVYAHNRGHDLNQNAIVGVFLRVLEYYNGVLFLTTNRAEDVDDAIASRCMARIDYAVPTPEDQTRIWRVLSQVMGISVDDATIGDVVRQHSALSGRDVKNLLKLAGLVASASGKPVTTETINFVKKFKPTVDGEER